MEEREALPEWLAAVRGSKQPSTIIGHQFADEDAIGTACGLAAFLRHIGCRSRVLLPEPFPYGKRWIAGFPQLPPDRRTWVDDGGVVVAVDSANLDRLGNLRPLAEAAKARGQLVNVDHHPDNPGYGNINHVDARAIATAEIVASTLRRCNLPINATVASALYTGLYADSGGFKYPKTSADTFAAAEFLARAGAEIDVIGERVDSITEAQLRLQSLATAPGNLIRKHNGQLVVAPISAAMLQAAGLVNPDTYSVISALQRVRNFKVVITLTEVPGTGLVRISVRTKEPYDASKIAGALGGGGHRLASGALAAESLATATAKMTAAALQQMTALGGQEVV